jgi:cyclic dehypoxanthinyl futalosine synthase
MAGHQATGEDAVPPAAVVEDYLRALAVSRIALDNVMHIQGVWSVRGAAVAGLALLPGADDLGMLAAAAGVAFDSGPGAEVSQVVAERVIRSAGLAPRQRRALFEPI